MLIKSGTEPQHACPFMNGLGCVGSKCAVWRWSNETAGDGYCGAGGHVAPFQSATPATTVALEDDLRVPRQTTKARAPLRRG